MSPTKPLLLAIYLTSYRALQPGGKRLKRTFNSQGNFKLTMPL